MFPDTLYRLYIINASFAFRAIWKLLKTFADPITAEKVGGIICNTLLYPCMFCASRFQYHTGIVHIGTHIGTHACIFVGIILNINNWFDCVCVCVLCILYLRTDSSVG